MLDRTSCHELANSDAAHTFEDVYIVEVQHSHPYHDATFSLSANALRLVPKSNHRYCSNSVCSKWLIVHLCFCLALN